MSAVRSVCFHSIFWTALLGLFAHLFINRDVSGRGVQRMKNAVLVDLTSLILWFITALMGGAAYFRARISPTDRDGVEGESVRM